MFKRYLVVAVSTILVASCVSTGAKFSGNPSVTNEQVNTIISNHEFTAKELKYKKAFLNANLSAFDKIALRFYRENDKGILSSKEKIKEKMVECNIVSYQAYTEALRNVPFDVVEKGGSYPDAKMAFDNALGEKMEEIGREKTLSMIQGAGMIVKACTDSQGIYMIKSM